MASPTELDGIFDKIAQYGADVGVMEQVQLVMPILLPLQGAQSSRYIRPTEHTYGAHPKQKLDVYLPKLTEGRSKAAVLVFLYGGGFAQGGKRFSPGAYECLGTFFANKGFVVLVVDYRLIGPDGGKFPSGPEDISTALEWLAKGSVEEADLDNVFLMGESAGGMHCANYLWRSYNDIKSVAQMPKIKLKGLILLSICYGRSADKLPPPVLAYYGSPEAAADNWALKLRQESDDATPTLVLYAEHDPVGDIAEFRQPFLDLYKDAATARSEMESYEAKRHNHISLALVLGLGYEEDWAHHTADWMDKHVSS